jgi:hypothetical protein
MKERSRAQKRRRQGKTDGRSHARNEFSRRKMKPNSNDGVFQRTVNALAVSTGVVPVGGVIPWFKDLPGVPALPFNFVECNGQFLSDAASPLDGQLLPDINTGAQRFIRGGLSSGTVGGISDFATAQADNAGVGTAQNFVTTDFTPGAQPFPPYVTAVYVIRVK